MATPMTARILDFDTNKLNSVYGRSSLKKQNTQRSVSQLITRLSSVLQTSIELAEILHIFNEEVRQIVPFDGLAYQHQANRYENAIGKTNGHSSSYRLQTPDDHLGELSFHRKKARFTEAELETLERLIVSLIYPLRNGLRYQEAVKSALTDALTGAGNRISMENVMTREFDLASRYHQSLSILMIDLDHFKHVNDQYGHAAGDYVLKSVVHSLQAASRCADMTFRYGGEEFVVLLNKTDIAGSLITAERLRTTIANLSFNFENQEIPVTLSIGAATLVPGESKETLLDKADKALYHSKETGRNRITHANQLLVAEV
ncbi:hypothetical protein A9Q99_02840 [Gammaproteobacteria bacterium 45_16_T64]|nr:hypothetical protein A9Q99_02840 [Gammaproteobacteria bacterium 45_16_T64]